MKTPAHLTGDAAALYAAIASEFGLEHDTAALRLLQAACEAWQRLQAAREILDRDGIVVLDRFGQSKAHPAIGIERDSRVGFCRCLRELGLEPLDDADASRPPRVTGRKGA